MEPAAPAPDTNRVITTVVHPPLVSAPPRYNGITILAGFKLAKGILVGLVAVGALELRGHAMEDVVSFLIAHFHMSPESRLIQYLWGHVDALTDGKLRTVGGAALLYSMLELLEAYGLFMRRHWAEMLTIIATSIPVPIELYEIWSRVTISRVGVLLFNLAIVGYLVVRRQGFLTRKQRKELRDAQDQAAAPVLPSVDSSPSP